MNDALDIVDVEIIRDCGIVVQFSDGTVARYTPEQLAGLRPYRDFIDEEIAQRPSRG
jgi:hypothetical protein